MELVFHARQFQGGFVPDAGIVAEWIRKYTPHGDRVVDVSVDGNATKATINFDPTLTDIERAVVAAALSTVADMSTPQTADRKQYLRSSAYSLGTRLFITGCADDRALGRGKGARFEIQRSALGTSDWLVWKFNDWVELGGGGMFYKGAIFGDWICFRLVAPATAIVPNAGAGNCNLHASGILIPAANDGAYDVDLTSADAFVPLLKSGGLWKWSYPDTGLGEIEAAPNGDGNCHLVPAAQDVHTYVNNVGALGDGELNVTFPGIDPTRIPPQWQMECRINNADGDHNLQVVWELEVGRINGSVVHQ